MNHSPPKGGDTDPSPGRARTDNPPSGTTVNEASSAARGGRCASGIRRAASTSTSVPTPSASRSCPSRPSSPPPTAGCS